MGVEVGADDAVEDLGGVLAGGGVVEGFAEVVAVAEDAAAVGEGEGGAVCRPSPR